MGYSYNQFIVEAIKAILEMIDGRGVVTIPKLVLLSLTARFHEIEPVKLGKIWPSFLEVPTSPGSPGHVSQKSSGK